ncbi:MAG: hypothetical protein ACTSV3_03760 [Candidatus Thorarchaeota archaeon]
MKPLEDLLPVVSMLIVVVSMTCVNVWIIGEPLRSVSSIPILVVLLLWLVATMRTREE